MFKRKLDQGNRGEEIAAEYLRKKGFHILDRNFRIRGGELDIVATHDNTLIFIEVKTRTSQQFGTALEAITPWKLKSLIKTAQFYKVAHRNLPDSLRIDAVSVMLDLQDNLVSIEHMENISF